MKNDLKTYEEKYEKLTTILHKLDENNLSLHDMLQYYKDGLSLVKECNTILQATEDEVEQLLQEVQVVKH